MNERAHQFDKNQSHDTIARLMTYRDQIAPGGSCAFNRATMSPGGTLMTDFEFSIEPPLLERCACRFPQDAAVQLNQRPSDQERWNTYLQDLTSEPVLAEQTLANAVRSTWWRLCRKVGGTLRAPIAGPGGELGFQLTWNTDKIYLDIDIAPNNTFEWFCKLRETGKCEGSDDEPLTTPPEKLIRLLVRFCLAR